MSAEKSDSIIKETLKSLCCSNGWCYGVFWGFDQTNSLLLIRKDAYYEEQMAILIDSMFLQVHVLEGGVIGQVAFAKNHRWMYSDARHEMQNSLGSFESLEAFQDDSEFYSQFSMGIKTIALISIEPWGVVQLGSTQKNPETQDFIDQVKRLFGVMDESRDQMKLLETEHPLDSQFFDPTMQFSSSLLSSGILHPISQNFNHGEDFVLPSQPFPPLVENPIQIGSKSTNPLEQLLLDSNSFFDCSSTQALSSFSDCSVLTSSWPHLTSTLHENNTSFSNQSNYDSCKFSSLNAHMNIASTPLQPQNTNNLTTSIKPTDSNAKRSTGLLTLEELFQESDFATANLVKHALDEDLSQWFPAQPGPSSADLSSHATGLVPLSSFIGNNDSPINMDENLPTNSIQSSVTDSFKSNPEVNKCSGTSGISKLFHTKPFGWNETLIPVENADDLNFGDDDVSECISEKYVGSKINPNSLFSKLGLDQLLDGTTASTSSCSFPKSRFEDQSSSSATKRRKIDNFSWSNNQVKVEGLPSFDGKLKLLNPTYDTETRNIGLNCEAKTANREPAKPAKKKAKPGTKPRPKDRQMIQDRLAELRELIPDGEKMSIDRLLERTIRHLNFMQSLQKHAQSLKEFDKLKSDEVEKTGPNDGGGGATWAMELGAPNFVCPLRVEDLTTPGQMLIQIVCEEQGLFLEIVDIIRGFGLIVLKGVMEVRETNMIWAHFMVEAEGTRCVTRHDIFNSLIKLLQMTGQSSANASDNFCNVINSSGTFYRTL